MAAAAAPKCGEIRKMHTFQHFLLLSGENGEADRLHNPRGRGGSEREVHGVHQVRSSAGVRSCCITSYSSFEKNNSVKVKMLRENPAEGLNEFLTDGGVDASLASGASIWRGPCRRTDRRRRPLPRV